MDAAMSYVADDVGPHKEPVSNDVEAHSDPGHEVDTVQAVGNQAQKGVQKIEAVTAVWTTRALVLVYILIWLTYFAEGLIAGTQAALNPYVTSTFSQHSLTPVVGVVSTVVGACTNFTIAKVLDVFGRPQGFLLCVVIGTVGLIMMAACQSIQTYAAALVFYTVGNTGLQYTLSVFVADTSSLRNRGLMQAFAYSPNMITCWLAGPISTGFLEGPGGWPWAFGMCSILVPVVTLPLYGVLQFNEAKAKQRDLVTRHDSRGTLLQAVVYYCREFDIVGLVLVSSGVALSLLPFNLYPLQASGWASPLIICLLVFGVVLLVVFALWERFYAPSTFIPYSLLLDRSVVGACLLSATLYFSYFAWSSYFGSFLQVVNDLSITDASYVIQTYTVGSVLFGLAAGIVIQRTGRFKPVCLFLGVPLNILGVGLMMYFRQPNSSIGYIVMCQIFISFASGIVIICDEIAILAATDHQHIAVVLATVGFFGNIGGSIGLTVTGAIWEAVFPAKLAEYLPASQLPNVLKIYADLETQLSYKVGSPTRTAIQLAYGAAQRDILIAATVVWLFGAAATLMWRDIQVSHIKQVVGNVV